jgi:hypothetical protein
MMLLTGSAVATGFPTPSLDRNQAGGKRRFASSHLLNPAFEHPANIGRMTWDAHGGLEDGLTGKYPNLPENAPKKPSAKKSQDSKNLDLP